MDEKERLKIIVRKIGEQIENANELDTRKINAIVSDMPELKELTECREEDFFNYETIYDNTTYVNDENICTFTLKDNSRWRYIRNTYKCILHPANHFNYSDEAVFQCLDNKELFKCGDDDCNKFLKSKDEIVEKFYPSNVEYILFPSEWTDNGIEAWCKKRESKQEEYEERRNLRNLVSEERERLFESDCSHCEHMKRGECEFGEEYDYENNDCEYFDRR